MTKDWETYGSRILDLYLGEEQDLEDVIAPLTKDGALTGSTSAYRTRLAQLGILPCGSFNPAGPRLAFEKNPVLDAHDSQAAHTQETSQDNPEMPVSEVLEHLRSSTMGLVQDEPELQFLLDSKLGLRDTDSSLIETIKSRIQRNMEAWVSLIEGIQQGRLDEVSQRPEWREILASIVEESVPISTALVKHPISASGLCSSSGSKEASYPSFKDLAISRLDTLTKYRSIPDRRRNIPSNLSGRVYQTHTPGTPSISSSSLSLADTITYTASSYRDDLDDSDAYLTTDEDPEDLQGTSFGIDFQQPGAAFYSGRISPLQRYERESPSIQDPTYQAVDHEDAVSRPQLGTPRTPEAWQLNLTQNASDRDIVAEAESLSSKCSQPSLDSLLSSRSSGCPTFSDTTDSADGEASVIHHEWRWLAADTELPSQSSVPPLLTAIETESIQHLIQLYQAQTEGQSSSSQQMPSSATSSSSISDDGKSSSSRKTTRQDIETPSDVYDQGPSVKKGRKLVPPGEIRLACHFQKRNPERYPACGIRKNGFRTVAEIKQHFWRNHQQNPNYCPRCKASFDTVQLKDDHVRQAFVNPCTESNADPPEGLSHELCTALKRRVDKERDLFEQWFSIWDMVFPGVPRPGSPMFDLCGDVHIQTLDLAAFLETEGPGVVTSMLREEGHLADMPSTEVDASIGRVVNAAFKQIFQTWKTQRGRLGSSGTSPSGVSPEPILSISEMGTHELSSPTAAMLQQADKKESGIPPGFTIDFGSDDMPWYTGTWDEGDGFQFRGF